MNELQKTKISFQEFELDTVHRQLFCVGKLVGLNSKAFDLLEFLVRNSGRIVSKEEILDTVWQENFVEESNLFVQLSTLRKVLGETKNAPRFLVTVPGKGYKFIANTHSAETSLIIETHTISELTIEQTEESNDENLQLLDRQKSVWWKKIFIGLAAILIFSLISYAFYNWFLSKPFIIKTTNSNSIKSIAVLPFQFLNVQTQSDGLELGLTESLINRLSSLKNITVRPIGAVKKYTDGNTDLQKIGKELQVNSILEGNIQKDETRLRLTLRLLNTETGETIWNEQIDENFADIFAVQDKISNRVANSLKIALSDKEKTQLAKAYTQNIEAYKKYLIARHHWNKRTPEGFSQSIIFYNQAIDLDPTFALAYAGLADSYLLIGLYGIEPTTDAFPKARATAEKALEIDQELAEGYVSLAMVENLFQYDWKKAEEYFSKSLELRPNYSTGHHWFGLFLAMQGRTEEALNHLSQAKILDPLSPSINTDVAFAYYLGNQPQKAIEQLEKTIKENPDFANAYNHLGMSYIVVKSFDKAFEAFEKAKQFSDGKSGESEFILANGFANNPEKAKQLLAELPKDKEISSFDLAIIHTSINEKDKAIEHLYQAFEKKDSQIVAIKVYPPFESLRSEPKYNELLKKMNL